MPAAAGAVLTALNRFEAAAATLAYLAVAALLIGDIVGREIFSSPIHGAQKIAVYAAIVAGFLGLSLATADNMHLRPSFLDGLVPKRWVNTVQRLSDGFACLFFLTMAVFGAMFVSESMKYADRAAVLYWLLWPIQIVIPYALTTTAIRHGIFALWPALRPDATRAH
jgi:TRAP-type C4-dicarboxylate transport system permease small subunit